jgi:hypothetical protein
MISVPIGQALVLDEMPLCQEMSIRTHFSEHIDNYTIIVRDIVHCLLYICYT